MITYRKATINDITELVRLRIEFMKEAIKIDNNYDDKLIERVLSEYFNNNIQNGSFIAWLAVCGDRIIGTSGLCFYTRPPSYKNISGKAAYIMNMYTDPQYRHRGIASTLFENTVLEAKSLGYKKICLNATQMGRSLYIKFGFKAIDSEMELNLE